MSNPAPSGSFRFDPASGTWTWDERLFRIFGFAPGDVVPTAELILAHQHPDDRPVVEALLDDVMATGRPFSLFHRIRDAEGVVRQLVTVGAGAFEDTTYVAVVGYSTDVTEAVRLTTSREVDEAMDLMSQSRPAIDQAKGALMMRYGVDEDTAFSLLRRRSQLANVKVRDVSRALIEMVSTGGLPAEETEIWDRLADELRAG